MRISTFAVKTALILLAIAPAAAAAQSDNQGYVDSMEQLVRKRPVNPARPRDKDYGCVQIRGELAALERKLAGDMGGLRRSAEENREAVLVEDEERRTLRTMRDAANKVSPTGVALGEPIYAAGMANVKLKRTAQQIDNLWMAGELANDFNFIAARIPYLHKLAAERCRPEDEGEEGKVGK